MAIYGRFWSERDSSGWKVLLRPSNNPQEYVESEFQGWGCGGRKVCSVFLPSHHHPNYNFIEHLQTPKRNLQFFEFPPLHRRAKLTFFALNVSFIQFSYKPLTFTRKPKLIQHARKENNSEVDERLTIFFRKRITKQITLYSYNVCYIYAYETEYARFLLPFVCLSKENWRKVEIIWFLEVLLSCENNICGVWLESWSGESRWGVWRVGMPRSCLMGVTASAELVG
jgi:hypothetical protein